MFVPLLRPLFPFVIVPFKALKAVPWIKPNSCIFSQTYLYPSPFFWFKCVELTVTLRRFNPASRTNFMHSFGPFMPLVVSFRYFIAWWTERLQKQWLVHLFPPLKVKCVILQEKVMTVFLKISRQPLIRCDLSICLSIYHSFHTGNCCLNWTFWESHLFVKQSSILNTASLRSIGH